MLLRADAVHNANVSSTAYRTCTKSPPFFALLLSHLNSTLALSSLLLLSSCCTAYDVGLGFICRAHTLSAKVPSHETLHFLVMESQVRDGEHLETVKQTFLFPPVIVTLTNRRVYVILFFARPLGVFFFSWGST